MNKFEEVFKFHHASLDKLLDLAGSFSFDSTHPLHLNGVALYGSILELASSLRPLCQTEHFSSIPIVLRSLIEAYVDLENLSNDPKYGYSLELSYLDERLKFLNEAKNPDNIYLTEIAKKPDLGERIGALKKERERIIGKGHKKLKNYERFDKANMLSEYKTIYNSLCCAAHNNYRALRDRHMDSDGDEVEVSYFKKPDYDELEIWFGVSCEVLIRASYAIHRLLKLTCPQNLINLRNEFNIIRGEA